MLGFSQLSKPIKWQDLLERGKNGRNAFRTGAKIYFSEKNILGLGALLTELPAEFIALNTTFQIQYSPSHTGNVHGSCTTDFVYCMSLICAFQNLITENYNSFILTIRCILL